MFGAYRTVLALMVVFYHIGGIPHIGSYAVFGFYALSGYLMTFVIQETYGYTAIGLKKYTFNRLLRIYPMYWASIIFSIILIMLVGEQNSFEYHKALFLPDNLIDSLKNLLLFFPFRETPRLTPPAWALTVEIFYYILIGVGLSKHKKVVIFWLVLSFIYHVAVGVLQLGFEHRYYTIPAASLPFSVGALIFHYRELLQTLMNKNWLTKHSFFPYFLGTAILFNWYLGRHVKQEFFDLDNLFFYSNFGLCVLMIIVLKEKKSLPFISKKLDNWLGSFSYPIYLIHYQVAFVVLIGMDFLGKQYIRPNFTLMLISLPFLFLVSWLLILVLEKPIEHIRQKIKRKRKLALHSQ
ncbi:acyltransferase [Paraglaciecola mesophila]|jgi:peptidoglycan/LPS O-acetylase OafA/YrhL|uniref:Acyltransferase n=1 Tax=Paraglaciecola mesophila TaxID=197222 RepID=A0ABU9SW07_9ALTE|tara:strand:+ start:587 stop:1639 length:1053 start_codon:yes stop_codon:yes gene_type:complete